MNTPIINNWEMGSDFHWLGISESVSNIVYPWKDQCRFFASGRDAICSLINHGIVERNWKRIWVPSYYCQEVIYSILRTKINLQFYEFNPLSESIDISPNINGTGDVILVVNYFGLNTKTQFKIKPHESIEIIEDHTHDPFSDWSFNSNANWCISSLRKTLPIPDGGILWSPRGHSLPNEIPFTNERLDTSLRKTAAMFIKTEFLHGMITDKNVFRSLFETAEKSFSSGSISGISPWSIFLLKHMPIFRWRHLRIRNYEYFINIIGNIHWLEIVRARDLAKSCPLSLIIVFKSNTHRQFVREQLIKNNIYPAVLWPVESLHNNKSNIKDIDFSRNMLSIPCDMRYVESDIEKVGKLLIKYGSEYLNNNPLT